ncbi:hypothetical protein B0T26DRAFT_749444 [Lasiosphaeria miniovina]|uniref:Uncharacterized protein n=1 Tax=Lasiosphaeria miniovina TaxID=1954250 RepID=A0AA40AU42_9PEZI|nr:uncharacterized protein B0T26DRAFT_749444 [Lasiosphaeria miniovina]KAK0721977.1 hypothetical protein B0T26DRAFT_749444 [Lasiosphaeria miniovina]
MRVYEDTLSVLWDEEWKLDDDSFSSAFADNSDDATTSLSTFNALGGSKIVSAAVTMDLPFLAFRAREEAVAETFARTYSWVFNREARVRSGAPIYWVTGKPGSGKSIRLALFIDRLDEFDVAPVKVFEMVDVIARKGGDGIKLCVASQPWTEFDDAYRDTVPALHMHLLTREISLRTWAKSLTRAGAVTEIRHIYPDRARQLEEGVVTLVVGALVESATEGSSIAELEAMLDALPEDIRALYDAIWARILPRTRRDGLAMIQLVLAAREPLSIVEIWRASEIRAGIQPVAMANTLGDELASQTRGILDLTSETYVGDRIDLTHRTFDPALILLKVTTAKMIYASNIRDDDATDTAALVKTLDTFDDTAQQWDFSVLPYIRAKALANPRLLVYKSYKHEFSVPLLECAILGYRRLNPESWTYPESLCILPGRRLKTVRFLFSKGVRQQWGRENASVKKSS